MDKFSQLIIGLAICVAAIVGMGISGVSPLVPTVSVGTDHLDAPRPFC